jgi:predicted phage-related endonuclease
MSAIVLDTLEYADKLREGGMSEQQAHALAKALAEVVDKQLATKGEIVERETNLKRDIKELETSLRRDMKELETSIQRDMKELETDLRHEIKESEMTLRRDMAEIKADMLKWLVGLLFLQAGFIVALIKLV